MRGLRPFVIFWVTLILTLSAAPPAKQTLISFGEESSRNWKHSGQSAKLKARKNYADLDLHFRRDDRQTTLSKARRINLESVTSFRLRTGIRNPAALLEGTLSFKSGNGWYVRGFTLHEPGFSHLLFTKSSFKTEGTPAGWDRVEEIRFSFWPRQKGSTQLQLHSLEAFVDRVWLVDTEPLAGNADEVYTSRVSVRHFDRLLSRLGLPHAVGSLEDLSRTKTVPDLIILPHLPGKDPTAVTPLIRLADRGSKLLVFGSTQPELAKRMGVRLGGSLSSSTVGQFDHWRSSRENFPVRIYQHVWSLQKILPVPPARTTAVWHDATGKSTGLAACIESPTGVWSSGTWHSGDLSAKQQALEEWIGTLAPHLLAEPLRYQMETQSPAEFETRYGGIDSRRSAPARQLKELALHHFSKGSGSVGEPLKAIREFRKSDQLMQRAFAGGQTAWPAEIRGIWDQNGTGFYAGSWDRTCRELKAAGFNTVFSNMASAGRAHYPSRLIPPSKSLEKYGDQLRAFSTAARKHGLEPHAWKICWKLNTRLPAFQEKMRREGRLMQDANGKEIPWLSFSHPANIQFEIDSLLEMARRAPLSGIHLDYMRYPGKEADYGPAARKAFEKRIGRQLKNWPRDVLTPGALKAEYQTFRQQQLHAAMQQISEAVKKEFPELTLSVAVWGAWPDCADAQGQDWPVWARHGWADLLIPMNYTDNPDQFAGWLDLQRAQPGVAERLVPGIGYISSNAELRPAQLIQQLNLIRERKLKGAVIYRLDSSLDTRLFPYLKLWK